MRHRPSRVCQDCPTGTFLVEEALCRERQRELPSACGLCTRAFLTFMTRVPAAAAPLFSLCLCPSRLPSHRRTRTRDEHWTWLSLTGHCTRFSSSLIPPVHTHKNTSCRAVYTCCDKPRETSPFLKQLLIAKRAPPNHHGCSRSPSFLHL